LEVMLKSAEMNAERHVVSVLVSAKWSSMSMRILTSVYIKVSLFPHFRIRFQTQHPIPLVTGAKSRIDVVSLHCWVPIWCFACRNKILCQGYQGTTQIN
jgi:hypothetical protein